MLKNFNIKPPFFEIGPKALMYGEQMLKLAKVIDKTALKYDVDVIVTPQYTDISLLAQNTERILVFAQHMDYLPIGRGLGSVLPEAVKAAGAHILRGGAFKPRTSPYAFQGLKDEGIRMLLEAKKDYQTCR